MSFTEFRDWLREAWPQPPTTPLARLQHTLDVYDSPLLADDGDTIPEDGAIALYATGGMYADQDGKQIQTGLTWGDLRKIRDYLDRRLRTDELMATLIMGDKGDGA